MIEDIESQLSSDEVDLCKGWVSAQIAPNNCRVLINEKTHSHIHANRHAQKHVIAKKNVDRYFLMLAQRQLENLECCTKIM